MTDITAINVQIATGEHEDAGTGNGTVYLGICGREFCCDTGADDFMSGDTNRFIFGFNANVLNTGANDPRRPQLSLEDIDRFPVYIRHDQRNSSHWLLFQVSVVINNNPLLTYSSRLGIDGIWLGVDSGEYYHLFRHIDPGLTGVEGTTAIS